MSWDLLCLKPKENTHSNRLWQAVTKQAWNPRKIPTKNSPQQARTNWTRKLRQIPIKTSPDKQIQLGSKSKANTHQIRSRRARTNWA
jgi:hypothetical protein